MTGPSRWGGLAWGLAAVLIAALLRWKGLASWGFEQDELYTLVDAVNLGRQTEGPGILARPLYYLLQHLLLNVTPPTEFHLRLPAYLFGVLGVWLTFALGRRTFGLTAGVVAALLLALSPWHLYASQFARYWTLVYVWSALLCLTLPRAVDEDRPRHYVAALLVFMGGLLTHPTFAFAAAGIALAVTLGSRDGRLGWRWPTTRGWLFLWGPLVLFVVVHAIVVIVFGTARSFGTTGSRGVFFTLRTIPAMVQWIGVEIAVGAAAGALFLLLRRDDPQDRRWGLMAVFGTATLIALIVLAGRRSPVYADYGMAMLPLAYVSLGGAVQRMGQVMAQGRLAWAVTVTIVLALSGAPGTISHLIDGTRYDYRPVYSYLAQHHGGYTVLGWPTLIQRQYAPGLAFQEFLFHPAQLESYWSRGRPFWVVTSHARDGMVGDDGRLLRWLDTHCRVVGRYGRVRLDYRSYRVQLAWCGTQPPGGAS